MNPIFKVTNGVYVDLSSVVAIRMDVEDRIGSSGVYGEIIIQFEKTPEQMMCNPSNSDFGQVKLKANVGSIYSGGTYTFDELYYGKMSIENYKRTGGDPEAAIEDFRVKFEAKYQYVLDAWTEYKLSREFRE